MTFDPRATLPWRLVAGLGMPFGYERSIRLGPRSLLSDRFLLSVSLGPLGARGPETVREWCAALAMPDHLRNSLDRAMVGAGFVHVGYEAGPGTRVYKLYLERRLPPDRPMGPLLLHEAFKWDAARPGPGVVARYVWHSLGVEGILERLTVIYGGDREAFNAAASVIDLAVSRSGPAAVRYLEVTEDGNPRRSFDLNLYDAELRVRDIGLLLNRLCDRYVIPADQFAPLYERVQDRELGHVAGGIHRARDDFFTVYYGVEEGRADS